MSANEEKLLSRIRKLLALAGSGGTAEAASAAAEVQRLMIKHGLEMADVEGAPPPVEGREYRAEGVGRAWLGVLARGVCDACGVEGVSSGSGPGRHVLIVGRGPDVAAACLLLEWLRLELLRACDREWRIVRSAAPSGWRTTFLGAAAATVQDRLREDRGRAERAATSDEGGWPIPGRGVALIKIRRQTSDAVARWLDDRGIVLRQRDVVVGGSADAMSAGRRAGREVSLSAPKNALRGRRS